MHDPTVKSEDNIVVGILRPYCGVGDIVVAEVVRPDARCTVAHAGNHEKTVKALHGLRGVAARVGELPQKGLNVLVVGDGVTRSDGAVTPTVILN